MPPQHSAHPTDRLGRKWQYPYRKNYEAVGEKLQNGESLSEDDKRLLAELVIADANSYVEHQKEFEIWKAQMDRLFSELQNIHSKGSARLGGPLDRAQARQFFSRRGK